MITKNFKNINNFLKFIHTNHIEISKNMTLNKILKVNFFSIVNNLNRINQISYKIKESPKIRIKNIHNYSFTIKIDNQNPKTEKNESKISKEFIIERLKVNLIEIMKERFDILGTQSSFTNIFDFNSPYDIVIHLKNTKYLKVFGANNMFFNNSKYVLLETDEKLNLNLSLSDELYLSKSEIFNLLNKMLIDLEVENFYTENEIIKLIDKSYKKNSNLNVIIELLENTVKSSQIENKNESKIKS